MYARSLPDRDEHLPLPTVLDRKLDPHGTLRIESHCYYCSGLQMARLDVHVDHVPWLQR